MNCKIVDTSSTQTSYLNSYCFNVLFYIIFAFSFSNAVSISEADWSKLPRTRALPYPFNTNPVTFLP